MHSRSDSLTITDSNFSFSTSNCLNALATNVRSSLHLSPLANARLPEQIYDKVEMSIDIINALSTLILVCDD